MVFAHKRTTTPRPQTRRNLYPQYQRKSYGWGTAYLRYGTCLADAKTGLAVDRGIHLAQKNCYPGKWPNRFRDAWERLLQFNKNTKFNMYQDAVMVPMGGWAKTRLKHLSETDKRRDNSRVGSGFGKNISRWVGRGMAYPSNVLAMATETSNRQHSAVFPKELPSWFIKLFTQPGDVVLGPFLGSGTTSIAAMNYYKLCGQSFWELISGDVLLYKKIIQPMDKEAKKRDDAFKELYIRKINEMTEKYCRSFLCEGRS